MEGEREEKEKTGRRERITEVREAHKPDTGAAVRIGGVGGEGGRREGEKERVREGRKAFREAHRPDTGAEEGIVRGERGRAKER